MKLVVGLSARISSVDFEIADKIGQMGICILVNAMFSVNTCSNPFFYCGAITWPSHFRRRQRRQGRQVGRPVDEVARAVALIGVFEDRARVTVTAAIAPPPSCY